MQPIPASMSAMLDGLEDADPVVRARSREALVHAQSPELIAGLVERLSDTRSHVRWEAAKALEAIGDPIAAPGLLHAMDDDDADVRWIASEALTMLGRTGLNALLFDLTKQSRSIRMYMSAHHVLHNLSQRGWVEVVRPVLGALAQSEPAVSVPGAALEALRHLRRDK